ncbi:MAG TPA: chromate transporter, partial [Candidatus Limnocylindrales bacterium]|nr:chromate transporter [Candidatus Limnocylindrales bacterium]
VGASAGLADSNAVRALMCLAVAIVANAVIDMGRAFWTGPIAIGLGAGVFALTLAGLATYVPVAGIALSAGIGALVMRREASGSLVGFTRTPSRRAGAAMLLSVPIIGAALWSMRDDSLGYLASAMFNAGSLVIGGGHVVLPLLDASVGPLVDPEAFLAGYGMAQAMPGPLFTFSTYLGHLVGGPAVALLATIAIFLPGLLLALGTLPFWAAVRHAPAAGGAVAGASAAVVGLLAATLVHPLLTETVIDWRTAVLAAALFAAARWARPPIWMLLAATLAASLLLG